MLSPMYIFSAHNIRLALSDLHGDLGALHCSSDWSNMGPGRVSARQVRGDSGSIGNDKLIRNYGIGAQIIKALNIKKISNELPNSANPTAVPTNGAEHGVANNVAKAPCKK